MQTLKDWLQEGPFTLTMSAGFFSFFAHCGMVSVLEEEGLIPAKLTGASAGALIGACWGSGCPAGRIKEQLFRVSKADFWDPTPGFGLLKGKLFHDMVADLAGVERLEDCPIPVAVSASDMFSRTAHVFSTGSLAQAVHASSAVPFLFHPVRIQGRYYVDGGVKDRHGLAGAGRDGRIFYHHIASRSAWRRKNSTALQLPKRDQLVSLVIADLPRSGPNRLDQGPPAYEHARRGMQFALKQSIQGNVVRVE